MSSGTSIPGVQTREVGDSDVTAFEIVVDALADIVAQHDTLYDWAAALPQPRALRGRAPVYVAALPNTHETIVVRHGWHGGLLAPVTGDRFRLPTRAPLEMWQSYALRQAGISTSEVLGFARYPAGPGLRRLDVVTRFVPDAYDLGMIAAGLAPHINATDAMNATIALLVQLASHGVIHPDLNVKNILVRHTIGQSPEAMVIDIDVVRWNAARRPVITMRANLTRLLRSMRKWRANFGCDIADERMARFERDALAATPK